MKKFRVIFLILIFGVTVNAQKPCPGQLTLVYAGKTYNTVQIGTQCWLKENLNVGTMIPVNLNASDPLAIEKYCYDNKLENCNKYGGLYQWSEAMGNSSTEGSKGICPDEWHIPTLKDFEQLDRAVNNNSNALKNIGEGFGDGAGTNTSGFSALLAGYRFIGLSFYHLGNNSYFWSSTNYSVSEAYNVSMLYYYKNFFFGFFNKEYGLSVRCIKDGSVTNSEDEFTSEILDGYALMQNYPNPFNPTTRIEYEIPEKTFVTIQVFNLQGQMVSRLVNENKERGKYKVDFNAKDLPSGIYVYKIITNKFSYSRKMILIK